MNLHSESPNVIDLSYSNILVMFCAKILGYFFITKLNLRTKLTCCLYKNLQRNSFFKTSSYGENASYTISHNEKC